MTVAVAVGNVIASTSIPVMTVVVVVTVLNSQSEICIKIGKGHTDVRPVIGTVLVEIPMLR